MSSRRDAGEKPTRWRSASTSAQPSPYGLSIALIAPLSVVSWVALIAIAALIWSSL